METKLILNTIDYCLQTLNEIKTINSGGCGIASLAIAKIMKKHNIEFGCFSLLVCEDEVDDVHNNFKISNFVDVPFDHITVRLLNGTLIDSTGVSIFDNDIVDVDINYKQLLRLINYGTWNRAFDRKKYIPIIEKQLNISLKEVKYEMS